MGRVSRVPWPGPLVLALVLLASTATAQIPPVPAIPNPAVAGPVLNQAWAVLSPEAENESGEDLRTEDIDLAVHVEIRNLEIDLLGILFGGGKAELEATVAVGLAFRAISLDRLDSAMQATTGDANVSLRGTLGLNSSRMVLTAEEVRLAGGGAVLRAFQPVQEEATRDLIEESLPGSTVLSVRFRWANIVPAEGTRERQEADVDLREPPILLNATATIRFLDRIALKDLLESLRESRAEKAERGGEKTVKERIEENQTLPASERSAFMTLGLGQLVDLKVPPGWLVNLTIEVPKGYTIESATSELLVDGERRAASYFADGSARTSALDSAGVLTISNRFAVTVLLSVAALAVGLVARFAVENGFFGGRRLWRRSRAKP